MEDELQKILVSLASRNNFISYDELISALGIDNICELENFVINAISQEIIKGRLNPLERKIEINDWSSQKISDELDLDVMEQTLVNWTKHCESFVSSLTEEIERSNKHQYAELARERKIEEEVEKIKKSSFAGKYNVKNESQENLFNKLGKNDAKRYKGNALRIRRN